MSETIRVYPLSDKRVYSIAEKEWSEYGARCLSLTNDYYCIKEGWFCKKEDSLWDEDYLICSYDDYLKENQE